MKNTLQNILVEIDQFEKKTLNESIPPVKESYKMIDYLKGLLSSARQFVLENEFKSEQDEIYFFRNVKPQILGKLIFYNKVIRMETACPVPGGEPHFKYFSNQLKALKQKYREYICASDFYKYYRSGRTDKDHIYFRLGHINYHDGLSSFVFDIDPKFSTYYDNKVAQIIANDTLYGYILTKFSTDPDLILPEVETKDLSWTESKNALIELIYALIAAGAVSHGKIGVRKLSLIAQTLFRIPINDIHHAFHRMKTRAGSRTAFLDHLKNSLEEYMDKDL